MINGEEKPDLKSKKYKYDPRNPRMKKRRSQLLLPELIDSIIATLNKARKPENASNATMESSVDSVLLALLEETPIVTPIIRKYRRYKNVFDHNGLIKPKRDYHPPNRKKLTGS